MRVLTISGLTLSDRILSDRITLKQEPHFGPHTHKHVRLPEPAMQL
jgi:hypothetical protein